MLWFKKHRLEVRHAKHEKEVTLEVAAHKLKQKKAGVEAKKATDNLVRQVRDSGCTWKLYSAIGGRGKA